MLSKSDLRYIKHEQAVIDLKKSLHESYLKSLNRVSVTLEENIIIPSFWRNPLAHKKAKDRRSVQANMLERHQLDQRDIQESDIGDAYFAPPNQVHYLFEEAEKSLPTAWIKDAKTPPKGSLFDWSIRHTKENGVNLTYTQYLKDLGCSGKIPEHAFVGIHILAERFGNQMTLFEYAFASTDCTYQQRVILIHRLSYARCAAEYGEIAKDAGLVHAPDVRRYALRKWLAKLQGSSRGDILKVFNSMGFKDTEFSHRELESIFGPESLLKNVEKIENALLGMPSHLLQEEPVPALLSHDESAGIKSNTNNPSVEIETVDDSIPSLDDFRKKKAS